MQYINDWPRLISLLYSWPLQNMVKSLSPKWYKMLLFSLSTYTKNILRLTKYQHMLQVHWNTAELAFSQLANILSIAPQCNACMQLASYWQKDEISSLLPQVRQRWGVRHQGETFPETPEDLAHVQRGVGRRRGSGSSLNLFFGYLCQVLWAQRAK